MNNSMPQKTSPAPAKNQANRAITAFGGGMVGAGLGGGIPGALIGAVVGFIVGELAKNYQDKQAADRNGE